MRPFTTFVSACTAAIIGLAVANANPESATESVWQWYATCSRPFLMRLEVSLNGAVVAGYSVPICKVPRSDRPKDPKILKFVLHPDHRIVWTGYREVDDTTDAGEEIEGDIWQAGGESDALVLGVTFAVKDKLLMNTLHVARTANRAESEIAKGLSVTTRPVKGASPAAQ